MIERIPIIGVMGSHEREWAEYARPLGRMIADYDYHLLTGAGAGVMTAVAGAFVACDPRKGLSIGIVPTIDYDGRHVAHDQYPNPYIELPILTPLDKRALNDTTPYSRNYVNVMTSHALVILPGEHGTQNEVSLALHYDKPMIFFGPEEAFDKFPPSPTRTQDIQEVKEFLEQTTAQTTTDDNT
ncbi:MAG: hypothetical protein IT559_01315 [Alphaproteobacteria bacterium]|nr:hypothetical protein [Alphaproteobacteria bacterium]